MNENKVVSVRAVTIEEAKEQFKIALDCGFKGTSNGETRLSKGDDSKATLDHFAHGTMLTFMAVCYYLVKELGNVFFASKGEVTKATNAKRKFAGVITTYRFSASFLTLVDGVKPGIKHVVVKDIAASMVYTNYGVLMENIAISDNSECILDVNLQSLGMGTPADLWCQADQNSDSLNAVMEDGIMNTTVRPAGLKEYHDVYDM